MNKKNFDKWKSVVMNLYTAQKWETLETFIIANQSPDWIANDVFLGAAYRRTGKKDAAFEHIHRAGAAVAKLFKLKRKKHEIGSIVLVELLQSAAEMQDYALTLNVCKTLLEFGPHESQLANIFALASQAALMTKHDVCKDLLKSAYATSSGIQRENVIRQHALIEFQTGYTDRAVGMLEELTLDIKYADLAHLYGHQGDLVKSKENYLKSTTLNKCRVQTKMVDFDNLPKEFTIPNDQGFGDIICLIPTALKLAAKGHIINWQVNKLYLPILELIKGINWITEAVVTEWMPSGYLVYLWDEVLQEPYIELNVERTGGIGIITKGNPRHVGDFKRSLKKEDKDYLLSKGNFIDLDFNDSTGSWLDTAKQIKALDVLISVDSGPAHLAAALGTKTIILNRKDYDYRFSKHAFWQSATLITQERTLEWKQAIDEAIQHVI